LARIRLAVELLKAAADPKSKAGLEQDIAELDGWSTNYCWPAGSTPSTE